VELDEARSLLGVSPTDEWDAVRIAYRRLIRQQHPDRAGPGATVRAAQLNDAYRVLSRALQVQTADGIRPRRRLADPPPPRFDAHIEGADTLVVEAPREEAFSQLLEAGHVVGHVSYVDRSSAIFEVVVKHDGEACSFVVSLEGEGKTEALCTLESMERSQRLSPTPIVRQLAAALRTPWVSPLFGPEDDASDTGSGSGSSSGSSSGNGDSAVHPAED
jgi:curved DNA-binding protein CbpA